VRGSYPAVYVAKIMPQNSQKLSHNRPASLLSIVMVLSLLGCWLVVLDEAQLLGNKKTTRRKAGFLLEITIHHSCKTPLRPPYRSLVLSSVLLA
jgi:hypothetical protein